MTKMIRLVVLTSVLGLAGQSGARAQAPSQPDHMFSVGASIGTQISSHTVSNNSTFVLYGEGGSVSSRQKVGSGFVFDASGEARVWRKLSVGLGVWTFHTSSDAALTAVIPNPLVFQAPTTVSLSASGLSQTNVGFDIDAIWTLSLPQKITVAIMGGPTILYVNQEFPSIGVAAGTQNATVVTGSESATTAKAGNVGVDVRYRLTDRYSAGVLLRYVGGQVDLPTARNVSVGGFQIAAGIRAGF